MNLLQVFLDAGQGAGSVQAQRTAEGAQVGLQVFGDAASIAGAEVTLVTGIALLGLLVFVLHVEYHPIPAQVAMLAVSDPVLGQLYLPLLLMIIITTSNSNNTHNNHI